MEDLTNVEYEVGDVRTPGKQVQAYRSLANFVAKSSLTSQDIDTENETWRQEIRAILDGITLKSLFFSEDWVYIICDLTANKISTQPLGVMRRAVEQDTEVFSPVASHELNGVFQSPNPWQSYAEWMYNYVIELILMGNGVQWWADANRHLTTMPTELIDLQLDDKCRVQSYRLMSNGDESGHCTALEFKPEEVIHTRRPNPSSLLWGLSPFVPGRKAVLFNRYSTDYLNQFYVRQATPGLALVMQKQVNEDVALRQLQTFESAYTGRRNARRTLVVPKGVDVKTLTHTLADQKIVDMIDKNRETIINLLKVPKHELGIQKVGSLGSEEARLALRNFWEATLLPTMGLIEGSLTKFFRAKGLLAEDLVVKFDVANVEALQEDKLTKAKLAKELLESGWTVNEVRAKVYAMGASDDPDAALPYNLVRLAKNTQGLVPVAETEEPDRQDEVEVTQEQLSLHDKKIISWRDTVLKQLEQEVVRDLPKMVAETLDVYAELADATILEVIAQFDKLKGVGNYSTKMTSDEKERLKIQIRIRLGDSKQRWVKNNTDRLQETVELGYDLQVEGIFDPRNEEALREIGEQGVAQRRSILERRMIRSFDQLTDSATEEVMKEIETGIDLGEDLGEITNRILNFYGPNKARFRAERVARTEVLTAVSVGQWEATKDAKQLFGPGVKKRWLTAGDGRVRDSHRPMHNETVGIDEKFSNDLDYPRDATSRDAGEIINCRCTMVIIPPEGD